MRKGIIKCPIDRKEYNKQTHCAEYVCETCPRKDAKPRQTNFTKNPNFFSFAYLGYLSNKCKLKVGNENGLPPLFTLSNIYRDWLILEQLDAGVDERNKCLVFINKITLDILNNLSESSKSKLLDISASARTKLLVALHDLTELA